MPIKDRISSNSKSIVNINLQNLYKLTKPKRKKQKRASQSRSSNVRIIKAPVSLPVPASQQYYHRLIAPDLNQIVIPDVQRRDLFGSVPPPLNVGRYEKQVVGRINDPKPNPPENLNQSSNPYDITPTSGSGRTVNTNLIASVKRQLDQKEEAKYRGSAFGNRVSFNDLDNVMQSPSSNNDVFTTPFSSSSSSSSSSPPIVVRAEYVNGEITPKIRNPQTGQLINANGKPAKKLVRDGVISIDFDNVVYVKK